MNADQARSILFTVEESGEISEDEEPDFVEENIRECDVIDGFEVPEVHFNEQIEESNK